MAKTEKVSSESVVTDLKAELTNYTDEQITRVLKKLTDSEYSMLLRVGRLKRDHDNLAIKHSSLTKIVIMNCLFTLALIVLFVFMHN